MLQRSIALLALAACAAKARVVFHPTDGMFSPRPGPTPPAFTRANLAELPNEPMYSVGTIEVTVSRGDRKRAIELATDKGRELGCWVLVEHAAFVERRAQHADVQIVLVHGGVSHAKHARPPTDVVQFDCVIRGITPTTV